MSSRYKFEEFRKQLQGNSEQLPESEDPKSNNAKIVTAVTSNLTSSLWRAVHKGPKKGEVISSLGISMLMAGIKLGAQDKTCAEIQSFFRFPRDETVLVEGFTKVFQSLQNIPELTFANGVFAPYGVTFKEKLLLSGQSMGAQFLNVDFSRPSLASEEINKWVQQVSSAKIAAVVSSEDVDNKTSLLLLNTVHFKGRWKYGFDPKLTLDKPFSSFCKPNDAPVKTMRTTSRFPYADLRNLNCRAVGLPYKGDRFMLVVILTDNPEGRCQMAELLDDKLYVNVRSQLRVDKEVMVELPKGTRSFKCEYKPIFEAIGIRSLFRTSADLKSMFENSTKPNFVSTVVQFTSIEFSEEGEMEVVDSPSTAASKDCSGRKAKEADMKTSLFPVKEPPVSFRVDRSFMFYVFDDMFESVILSGMYL